MDGWTDGRTDGLIKISHDEVAMVNHRRVEKDVPVVDARIEVVMILLCLLFQKVKTHMQKVRVAKIVLLGDTRKKHQTCYLLN